MARFLDILTGKDIKPVQEHALSPVLLYTDIEYAAQDAINEMKGMGDETVPALYRGVQYLTDSVASFPLRQVDEATGVIDLDTPAVLRQPNPQETFHDTLSQVMASLIFHGNAYLWVRRAVGNSPSVYVINPGEVIVNWDKQQLYPEYVWRNQEMTEGVDLIHIAINKWPGNLKGVGPITAARLMIQGAKAEQNVARRLMEDDAVPQGALKLPVQITHEEGEKILTKWEETHHQRKRPAILGGGADWVPMAFNPVDADFINSRRFTVQEIARLLGVDGHFLLVESGGSFTYQNVESVNRNQLIATLRPTYLERIEQKFSLLLPRGKKAYFDATEILRADHEARARINAMEVQNGIRTVHEIRKDEGYQPNPSLPDFPPSPAATPAEDAPA